MIAENASEPSRSILANLSHRLRYVGRVTFVVLSDSYGVVISLLLIAKLLVGEAWWPVGLLNSLLPVALLPALVMLPGTLVIRRWRLTVELIPPLLVLIFNYAAFFLPRSVAAADDAPGLTILTYNTHAETANLRPMIDLILEADPDVVALQEFTQAAADTFSAALADRYPYQALHPAGNSVLGKGFFSRYPILSESTSDDWARRFQRLTIDLDGQTVTLYNTHPNVPHWRPPYNAYLRSQNITDLLALAASESGPLLLMGDFNMSDQADDYRRITTAYGDSYREVGWGLGPTFPDYSTFTTPLAGMPPFLRLDYVFHNDDFRPISAQVWPTSGGSDHRPLLVRLILTEIYN